jgi:hypothetical protein
VYDADPSNQLSKGVSPMRKKLVISLLLCLVSTLFVDCGASSHLQSIQLTAPSAPEGFDVLGLGGTIQLVATGTYTNGHTKDVTNDATYQISITPNSTDEYGDPLPTPPQGLEIGPTGLVTAEYPGVCTWDNLNPTGMSPAWAVSGSYTIAATYDNVTSPAIYVAVASAAGIVTPSNPNGSCGPQPTSE